MDASISMGKLRADAFYELKEILEKTKPIYRSCVNCEHWHENKEICELAKARPPARVIVYACERWVDMEIPF